MRTFDTYITHIICYVLCAYSHGQRIVIIIIIIIIVFDRSENGKLVAVVVVSPQSFIFIANKYEKSSEINTCAAHCILHGGAAAAVITMCVLCTLLLLLLLNNTFCTPLGNQCVFVRYVCNKNNARLSLFAGCKHRIRVIYCYYVNCLIETPTV